VIFENLLKDLAKDLIFYYSFMVILKKSQIAAPISTRLRNVGKSFLEKLLAGKMSEEEIHAVYRSYDIAGDIAVIKVPDNLREKRTLIAEAVMAANRSVKSVLGQVSPVSGEYRVRELEWILGERRTEATYRENGCVFKVDLAKAYFSPRLSHERLRIAKLVQPGEVVVNMFAGVGPFSIVIAKHSEASRIYSIDVNPEALKYMRENITLNKMGNRIVPLLGDAKEVVEREPKGVADRVIMPLPEKASEYLDAAIEASKLGNSWLHYYEHVHIQSGDPVETVKDRLSQLLRDRGIAHEFSAGRIVRDVGPRWYQVVIDMQLHKAMQY
jgi:tRNA (guanine37-N1)-methyltransferase